MASVIGGLFIGIGCGLVVRQAYLFTDITVPALSLSYIPVRRIVSYLVTVTISSYLGFAPVK